MNKRKTGRTTRMLKHAQELSSQGRIVYVIAANFQQADIMKRRLGQDAGAIRFETVKSVGSIDWETLKLMDARSSNLVVLVDHYVIESRFAGIIEMLTRYDLADDKDHKTLKHSELIEQHE